MNGTLLVVGLAKILFGAFVGVIGLLVASRVLSRVLLSSTAHDVEGSNIAAGALRAASMMALGILAENPVMSTFEALDLTMRNGGGGLARGLPKIALYAVAHVGLTLAIGVLVLAGGVAVFSRLTPEINEIAEVRKGSVAPALILGAILVVLALLTGPGLRTALDGLIPYPALPQGEIVTPS